ncbi:multidrug resistance-associated protein 4-like [Contarinia nasturtii]|uniref:multidrug resistance-associated protein 4-like n=1 Tax=Contarinia nasturtii TaxID=265458 RepID=UPI0012D478FD|nr:multidrug resistance-associated protein 4-like [Contarinia nasturtii]XP_031635984.1 multidrug resistance-associated protein 4-like [Contarinia nasturtii]XP_031635985.1 multidrug resistance-associated protein 4-like [Contarinia nasturtii]
MESGKRKLRENPRESASFISQIFFIWAIPIFKTTYDKVLDANDANEPLQRDRSSVLGDRIEKTWLEECKKKSKPSLVRAVVKAFWFELIIMGILSFLNDVVIRLIIPFLLEKLLSYFRKASEMKREDALIYGTAIFVITIFAGISLLHYFFLGYCYGMRVRVSMCSLIYRKSLRLSQRALNDTAPGKLVNLLSNDVNRFDIVSVVIHNLWTSPIMTIAAAYILWNEIRWAAFIGLAIVFLIVPIQSYAGKLSAAIRFKTALRTDERVRFMDEIVSGVQVIKMYCWQQPFAQLIATARQLELKMVLKNAYVRALYMTFNLFTTRMALFCTVLSVILLYGREHILVSKIFMISYLFMAVSHAMCQTFVRGLAEFGEVLVSFKRLQMFLEYEETGQQIEKIDSDHIDKDQLESRNIAILMKNISARWADISNDKKCVKIKKKIGSYKNGTQTNSTDHKSFALQDIEVEIPKGKLVFVVGSVGCGKSTFMQVLLKELPLTQGSLGINGTVSYASQESWIFTSSIRQNITFGQSMDRMRYNEIVQSTALAKDFSQLSDGDMTLVGENGAGLSGGQKVRINLARAMYRKADIYLIDDPLSAVDNHVQLHLFNKCLGRNGYLARQHATRILITHSVHFLKEADWIIVLKNGKIEMQGNYDDILKSGIDFTSILNKTEENGDDKSIENDDIANIPRQNSTVTLENSLAAKTCLNNEKTPEEHRNQADEEKELLNALEASSKGKVKGSLAINYLKSAKKPFTLVFLVISFLLSQILASVADIWVSYWIRQEENRTFESKQMKLINESVNSSNPSILNESSSNDWSTETYTYIYAGIMASLLIIALTRSVTFFRFCAVASQKLHDSMFSGLIHTSMRFFNCNTSGRIMNRLSKDMGSTDEALPKSFLDATQINLSMVGAILVTVYTNVKFSIVILIMAVLFIIARNIYLKSSTNIKRFEGITKSPVFSHISATMGGLSTIRAFQAQNLLREEYENHQDLNTGTWYMYIGTSSGFGMSLDLMVYLFVGCVIYYFILINNSVTGDRVGLAITQALSLTGLLQWGVRQSAEVSNHLMSVERILEYSDLEPEKQPEIPQIVAADWPKLGKIEFRKVFYRYSASDEPVLRGLSFSLKPKEKVSVVGRTGAGKSSLIGSIFRLAMVDGDILIDNVNTSSLELNVLRSRISIIPQEPTLFSGTLRRNLDPFEEYSDEDIWNGLEMVGMKEFISEGGGLEMPVLAHGQNFSIGQRQILCLARAILRKNRIIILDEATANVDLRTDEMIQRTIRDKFIDSTVITVAHRLNTVIDSDRVLVMEGGVAVEFDEPYTLMQNKESLFCKMVEALGMQEFDRLLAIAKDKYKNLRNV